MNMYILMLVKLSETVNHKNHVLKEVMVYMVMVTQQIHLLPQCFEGIQAGFEMRTLLQTLTLLQMQVLIQS